MNDYFVNSQTIINGLTSEKDKSNIIKIKGLIVSDALKEYCKSNAIQPSEKETVLNKLKIDADIFIQSLGLHPSNNGSQKSTDSVSNNDKYMKCFDELKQLIETPTDGSNLSNQSDQSNQLKYLKDCFSSEQRKKLTIAAEIMGLVAYTEQSDSMEEFLIFCKSKNEPIDKTRPSRGIVSAFSQYTDIDFSDENIIHEIKQLELEETYNAFIEDIVRYGVQGFKRFYHILQEEIVEHIKSNNVYKNMVRVKHTQIPVLNHSPDEKSSSGPDKSFTICNTLYCPENDSKQFVSLDISAAVYLAYRNQGVFNEPWKKFMERFTRSQFLINSKVLRLKIFGKLDRNNMNNILFTNEMITVWNLHGSKISESFKFLALEGDEILLKPNNAITSNDFEQMVGELKLPPHVNAQLYRVKSIDSKITGDETLGQFYAKIYDYPKGKHFDVKCVHKPLFVKAYIKMCDLNNRNFNLAGKYPS